MEPGSNGRRSGRRLIGTPSQSDEPTVNEAIGYMRLDTFAKGIPNKTGVDTSSSINGHYEPILNPPTCTSSNATTIETIIMHPAELSAVIGNTAKRAKSMNSTKDKMNGNRPRTLTKSVLASQSCQSELELIFQVSRTGKFMGTSELQKM